LGIGDNIMASGIAKGASGRGKRIAFGDGRKIIWDHNSEAVFRGNPNVARTGDEGAANLEWVNFYRGNRLYNRQAGDRWIWNHSFKAIPGEFYLNSDEEAHAARNAGFIVIEPNTPQQKAIAPNKQWPVERYQAVADTLKRRGHKVGQLIYPGVRNVLNGATPIKTNTFRHAVAVLKNASLYIGPEGGLHHGAASVGLAGVVMFGGFIPPAVTGYSFHTNLTGEAKYFCGMLKRCDHCARAMARISVDEVLEAAGRRLKVAA
jgi:ADP-heptose:LPS heptosyltransferase